MTDDELDDFLARADADIIAALDATTDTEKDLAEVKLSDRCFCGRRVRVLWNAPLDETSRPVLLVCGFYPRARCRFCQVIDESHLRRIL